MFNFSTGIYRFLILDDAMLSSNYKGHAGMKFSTFDMDNDLEYFTNCASDSSGGWWFNACYNAYLNGPWFSDDVSNPWSSQYWSVKEVIGTVMSIKSN